MKDKFFATGWHFEYKNETECPIRIYGLTEHNESVSLIIRNFTPYVYIALPSDILWNENNIKRLGSKIDDLLTSKSRDSKPIKKCLVYKYKLYYADLDPNKERKKFPFLFCCFKSCVDVRDAKFRLAKPFNLVGAGFVRLTLHEHNADPILQLTSQRNIPTAGWIEFNGKKVDQRITHCKHEYNVKWKELYPLDENDPIYNTVPSPLVMSFDIEVNSDNPSRMPDFKNDKDQVFQISCIFSRDNKILEKYLLTLGHTEHKYLGEENETAVIKEFTDEGNLLKGFADLVIIKDPVILVGYNILGFDMPYMIERAKYRYVYDSFSKFGSLKRSAEEKTIKWSSSAYGNQNFQFLDVEGRVQIDLLPVIKRDYKLSNYKLNTVSQHFLGSHKDPLTAQGMFKCYKIGMRGGMNKTEHDLAKKAMGIIGKYCIVDSELCFKLFNHLQTWIGSCEMAKTCCVPIIYLYLKGQQIKVFSQIYKKCTHDNYVVEYEGYIPKEDEHYQGAMVFPPVPGVYDKVIPLDFCSLYPSVIIGNNLCYSTLVIDPKIPNKMCNVIEWDEHQGCEHDPKIIKNKKITEELVKLREERKELTKEKNKAIYRKAKEKKEVNNDIIDKYERIIERWDEIGLEIRGKMQKREKISTKYILCGKRKYRFLKKPLGILPETLQNLLSARKHTRKQIKEVVERMANRSYFFKNEQSITDYQINHNLTDTVLNISLYILAEMNVERKIFTEIVPEWSDKKKIELCDKIAEKFPEFKIVHDRISNKTVYSEETLKIGVDTLMRHSKLVLENHERDKSLLTVLDKRQLAYKVSSNSGYGSTGAQQGLLLCMPVAMCTTAIGREYIRMVSQRLPEHGARLIYGDSVSCDTPIIIKNKIVNIIRIDDLINVSPENKWIPYPQFKLGDNSAVAKEQCVLNNIKIWVDGKWANIRRVIRHKTSKQMFRVLTHTGCVDVTEDHSLIDIHRQQIKPNKLEVNKTKLLHSFPPVPSHKRTEDKYPFFTLSQLEAQHMFYNAKSNHTQVFVSYQDPYFCISIDDKPKIEDPHTVKKIIPLGECTDFVYDIETDCGMFNAGIGELVVKNTDSNYLSFPNLMEADVSKIWAKAEKVAESITNEVDKNGKRVFPENVVLDFESVIYWRFLILSKKRYMSWKCDKNGVVNRSKIENKGVILTRRDNCDFIRTMYADIVTRIFNKEGMDNVIYNILLHINKLCSRSVPVKDFIVTKSIKDVGDLSVTPYINEKGELKARIGDYIIRLSDDDKREIRSDAEITKGYIPYPAKSHNIKSLPAHIQLAIKMRNRGSRVDVGSRLEYIITDQGGSNANLGEKIEDVEYFKRHPTSIRIDYYTYLKQLIKPVNEILNMMLDNPELDVPEHKYPLDFIKQHYKLRLQKLKIIKEIETLFSPVIELEKQDEKDREEEKKEKKETEIIFERDKKKENKEKENKEKEKLEKEKRKKKRELKKQLELMTNSIFFKK